VPLVYDTDFFCLVLQYGCHHAKRQTAENACVVVVHFGVPSQVFVIPGFLSQLDMVPVALPILWEISGSRLKFLEMVKPR